MMTLEMSIRAELSYQFTQRTEKMHAASPSNDASWLEMAVCPGPGQHKQLVTFCIGGLASYAFNFKAPIDSTCTLNIYIGHTNRDQ